ncbi:three-helix bundle dimerization domain-containing protein [Streptomyces sp. NPDC090036]|uniref:three-helix bundle dimerization domain-containing protein n=1 Tax=Streptomyces sp. NPDC090036 TaxID=3365926 RepID=UPI003806B6CF
MASATLQSTELTTAFPSPEDPVARPTAPDELASARPTVDRLRAAYPLIDAAVVEATVTAAYDWFREARVRAYVPILAERRARKALDAVRTDVEAGI